MRSPSAVALGGASRSINHPFLPDGRSPAGSKPRTTLPELEPSDTILRCARSERPPVIAAPASIRPYIDWVSLLARSPAHRKRPVPKNTQVEKATGCRATETPPVIG